MNGKITVRQDERDQLAFFVESEDRNVCFKGYFGKHGPHVFAAAPDLYEELRSLIETLDTCESGYYVSEKARAALAKARGET